MNTNEQASIYARYRAANPKSQALYERALNALPGGNTRTTVYYPPFPQYFDHGQGCRVTDVDGNERLDLINNYTSLILGHSHPKVVEAVRRQAGRGVGAAAPSEYEIALAEEIKRRLPSVELLRFTNSGTEATQLAIRAARAFTGRDVLAKFEGGYHGSHDYAAANPAALGIPAGVSRSVITLPFNNREAVARALEVRGAQVAAVIVEPVVGSGGILIPRSGFLEFLREITRQLGILLIFDEVIAFRLSYHGAQGYFGVTPDLTALGKIIGGGLPAGAFGGRADILAQFDPRQPDFIRHGGTFNANPMTMVAGLATLTEMQPEQYTRLEGLAARLKQELCDLFGEHGVAAQVNQIGSLFNIHFADTPVDTYQAVQAGNRALLQYLYVAALDHGVAFTGRGMGCLSTPMGEAEVDEFVLAVKAALEDIDLA
jgi:glutamate-1-semialdehyde 2,1-aminomutase